MRHYHIPAIQELASGVGVGDTDRFICPCCGGGSSKERSLSVTRRSSTEAFFICYRAKCDLGSGHIALFASKEGAILKHQSKKPVRDKLNHNLTGLDEDTVEFFKDNYYFTNQMLHYGRFQLTFDRRVYMWVFDRARRKRGGVVRKYKELYEGRREYVSIPKTLNYIHDNETPLSWYYRDNSRRKASNVLVLVEDIPSALRLNPYVDSVALLGTGFGADKQKEIRSGMYDRVYLALDEDATSKAFRYRKQCQLYLPNMRVMALPQDFKNMTPEQIEDTLDAYCRN